MGRPTLSTLGKKRALDVLDFLNDRQGGARFGEISKKVANSVPSSAHHLLAELEACGAVARDTSNDYPRYRLTGGGQVARGCLHEALDALEEERSGRGSRRNSRGAKRAESTTHGRVR